MSNSEQESIMFPEEERLIAKVEINVNTQMRNIPQRPDLSYSLSLSLST